MAIVNDPISDMLARIRNASLARHELTRLPASKLKHGIAQLLKAEGYAIETVSNPGSALEAVQNGEFDIMLMDLNYQRDTTSGQEGIDLLTRIQDIDNKLPIIAMTAWGSVELAV